MCGIMGGWGVCGFLGCFGSFREGVKKSPLLEWRRFGGGDLGLFLRKDKDANCFRGEKFKNNFGELGGAVGV